MPLRPRDYDKPKTLKDALTLLRRKDARSAPILPGPRFPDAPYAGVEAVVDLSALDLVYLKEESGVVRLGALTPLQDLVESPLTRSEADGLLAEAAHFAAHFGLRHLATVGGAVLAHNGPPEVQLALLAFDASVVVQGDAKREAPLAEFMPSADELLIEVKFASQPKARGALERVARTPRDEAIVAAVAVIEVEGGVCRRVRLALGGVGPRPSLVRSVEKILAGQRLTASLMNEAAEAAEAVVNPTNDFRASADYRREMAKVLTRRALEAVRKRAE